MDFARAEPSTGVDELVVAAFLEKSWSYLTCPDPVPAKPTRVRSEEARAPGAARRRRGEHMYRDLVATA